MAIKEAYSGSSAIGATEFSAPNNAAYNINTPISVDGVYQVFLDTSDMTAGDELQIRVYEKCRAVDTQRVVFESILNGSQADMWVSPSLILLHGWDVTLDALSAPGDGVITVNWSIRRVA